MSMSVTVPSPPMAAASPQSQLSALLGVVTASCLIALTLGSVPPLIAFLLCRVLEAPFWMTMAVEGPAVLISVFGVAWFSRQAWVYERGHSSASRAPDPGQTTAIVS